MSDDNCAAQGCQGKYDQEIQRKVTELNRLAQQCLLHKLPVPVEEMTAWDSIDPAKTDLEQNIGRIRELCLFLEGSNLNLYDSRHNKFLLHVFALIGEHVSLPPKPRTQNPWSTRQLSQDVAKILLMLLKWMNVQNLNEYFASDLEKCMNNPRKTLYFATIQQLRSKVSRDNFKYYPAATNALQWLVHSISYPSITEYIAETLSSSLLLLDDYNEDYKLMGLGCIEHITKNAQKSSFLKENWALVLLNALQSGLYEKNSEVLRRIGPLILFCLEVVESNPNKNPQMFTKYDVAMEKLLTALECCSDSHLKIVYIRHITSFSSVMLHAALHWRQRICSDLLDLTSSMDLELWRAIIECLQVVIRNTWTKPASEIIAEILLRLMLNSSALDILTASKDERDQIISDCKETLMLLSYSSDFELVKQEIESMKKNPRFDKKFVQVLESINFSEVETIK